MPLQRQLQLGRERQELLQLRRVLPRLVDVGVWRDADLWKGFLMYCKILGAGAGAGDDACFAAALMLPAPQLQKLLAFAPKLKLPLKRLSLIHI